jgi:NAD/NADP transhydrogenase beta subunit
MARTGHEGTLQPMEIEMIIRNILEEKLLVRPRTKEFTVAFPALVLVAYLASLRFKSLVFISGLAAVIGQTSIVNTFSHLRTPVVVSIIRTLSSLAAGIGFAMVYLFLLMWLVAMLERWGIRVWQKLEKSA